MAKSIWGVDSAAAATQERITCVRNEFGRPAFWGRYLKTVPNRADGLTRSEIQLLHNSGIKIIPIYSDFKEATGYRKGQITAANAIFHANRLQVPKGVAIFANIEHFFSVDGDWIRGWVDAFYASSYLPGLYHDPVRGMFASAYCQAADRDKKVSQQAILWSAEPEPGVSPEKDAPDFRPAPPPCSANVWAWQYGRDAPSCQIDTNLINQKLFKHLW